MKTIELSHISLEVRYEKKSKKLVRCLKYCNKKEIMTKISEKFNKNNEKKDQIFSEDKLKIREWIK